MNLPSTQTVSTTAADISLSLAALRSVNLTAVPTPRAGGPALYPLPATAAWPPAAPGINPASGLTAAAGRPLLPALSEGEPAWSQAYPGSPRAPGSNYPADGHAESAPPTAGDTERGEAPAARPAPQPVGVLALLPPIPLSAVEAGLRQFLQQVERAGQCLTADRDDGGLWPWVVAGAAAAVACEIARRQFRSAGRAPDLARRPGLPIDPFLAG